MKYKSSKSLRDLLVWLVRSTAGRPLNSRFSILNSQRGQSLLEIIIVVAILAIIGGVTAQLVVVSLRGSKADLGETVAGGLAEGTFEAARGVAQEQWQNLFNLTHGTTTNYYPQQSGGKWVLTAGTENIVVDGVTYTRSFTIQHMCRSSGAITGSTDSGGASTSTCVTSGGSYDPSTEQVTATVSWPNAAAVTWSEYITRWANKLCLQTGWNSTSTATSTCPDTIYETSTGIVATSSGSSLELEQ